MTTALVISPGGADAPDLETDLAAAGIHVLGAAACDNLVHETVRHAPDVVVGWEPHPDDALFQATELLAATRPVPVLVFTADVRVESLERAMEAGVHAWIVQGYGAQRLRPLVQLAQVRFARESAQRAARRELEQRIEERKLVDRAKGILMLALRIPEDEAFIRLRRAAMQGQQRVGQLARRLIQAARDAEAVNRAGQLRMLSQRIAKLRALDAAGGSPEARALLADSVVRVRANIQRLRDGLSRATFGDLVEAVIAAWTVLESLLAPPSDPRRLPQADAAAEALLGAADRLTDALQAASTLPTLRIVNLCGRQRMLSQRLAKLALMRCLPGADRAALDADARRARLAFEEALRLLTDAPLSSPEICADLARARQEWQVLVASADRTGDAAGRQAVAGASEALLALFERLTDRYEHGVQSLLA